MNDWRSYDRVAETYERIHARHMAVPARDLVELAAPPRGGRLLDVGTGTGVALAAADELVGDGTAVGVDRSVGMLTQGVAARPGLRVAAADAIDLPFRDATFDVVTSSFVIHHFANPRTALFDMVRVLRPGGRIAVSAWTDGVDELSETWRQLVLQVVHEELLRDAVGQAAPGRDRFADRAVLQETLADAGLRRIQIEKREYRFDSSLDEYVEGMGTISSGRFVREMMGADGWASFLERAKAVYRDRFADPVHDFTSAWLAVGTKG